MHGANRLGGNSLSDLIVFGRRAGIGAADFAEGRTGSPNVDAAEVASVIDEAFAPFGREDGYNPYDVHEELQETMQALVGIIRTGPELEEALAKLEELKERTSKVQVKGGRAYNPGWNLATDLPSMITTSIAVAQGALNRKESRGGHTREDFPGPDPEMGKVNFVQRQTGEHGYLAPIAIAPEPLPEMPPELRRTVRGGHVAMTDTQTGTEAADGRGGRHRHHADLAGRRRRRRVHRLRHARRRGRGGARRHPPHSGRPTRRTWPAVGTARPASAGRARPRSTACPASCA